MYINMARTLIINVNKNDHLEIKLRTNLLSLKSSFDAFMWVLDDIEKATGSGFAFAQGIGYVTHKATKLGQIGLKVTAQLDQHFALR